MKHIQQDPESHDITALPSWGPYSKRFFGISRLADPERGELFTFFAVPSLYRRIAGFPDAKRNASYLPWEASPRLEYYSYRQQLEWKDRLYADLTFSKIGENSRLFSCKFTNNTELGIDFSLQMLSAWERNPQETMQVSLSGNGFLLDAVDYESISFQEEEYSIGCHQDGLRPGEEREKEAVGGSVLGGGFGAHAGDSITYRFPQNLSEEVLYLRYRAKEEIRLCLNGNSVILPGNGKWQTAFLGTISSGTLTLVSESCVPFQLDTFAIGSEPIFTQKADKLLPHTEDGPIPGKSILLHFQEQDQWYGLRFSQELSFTRQYAVADLPKTFLYESGVSDPTSPAYLIPKGNDCAYAVVLQPLFLEGNSSREYFALLVCGNSREEVSREIAGFSFTQENCQALQSQAKSHCTSWPGSPYDFSQKRMEAVILTNIVFPIYLDRSYIRHYTPGRCWDSLYQWDSGFIALGLLESDPGLALENLHTYLMPPENPENAFVRHGTLLPTQILLYHEILNHSPSEGIMKKYYPGIKKMFDFFCGKDPCSRIASFSKAGLLRPWKYGYNSGGWDDYPIQKKIFHEKAHHLLPVITTAMAIRCGKLLSYWAKTLGKEEDGRELNECVARLSGLLQKFSWNHQSGYFSYVEHDEAGNVKGPFLMPDGTDWNMGLDGISPLIAGAVTPEQNALFWERLFSEKHFRTGTGISTVDFSAPYFRPDGYANGSNWTAFEYFIWKTALDTGRMEEAWQIASAGLKLWQQETEKFYSCFEHFSIRSGRGTGWHHFSSFSTPYSIWFHAYFMPGHLCAGFDTQIIRKNFSKSGGWAELRIHGESGGSSGILAVTEPGKKRQVFWNGKRQETTERHPGLFEFLLPAQSEGILEII